MDSIIKKITSALGFSPQEVASPRERKRNELVRHTEARDKVTISAEAKRRYHSGEGIFADDE